MRDIIELRKRIDEIDEKLVSIFTERMDIAEEVARYKTENNKPVFDPERERELLNKVENKAGEKYGNYTRKLYGKIMELSRTHQNKIINK